MDPRFLPIVLFAAITMLLAAAYLLWRDFRNRRAMGIRQRLEAGRGPVFEGTLGPREVAPLTTGNGNGGEVEKPHSWFEQLVAEAGSDVNGDVAFLAALAVGLLVGGVIFLWNEDVLASVAGLVGGVLFVIVTLVLLRARRRRKLLEQLPEVMDFLARSVRSGESLDQAVAMAGSLSFRPTAHEFRRCSRQLEMGLSLDAALRNLARRNPVVETRILAATLTIQRQTGGNLPNALERLAKVFRDRLAYQRQFRAATATSRGSVMLIVVIALVLDAYMLIARPEYVKNLLEMPVGNILLGASLVLQIIGATWAYLTLKTDY